MKVLHAAVSIVAMLAVAESAHALPDWRITYDLSGSSVQYQGQAAVGSFVGSITGQMVLEYTQNGSSVDALVSSLSLDGTGTLAHAFEGINVDFSISLDDTLAGVFVPGLDEVVWSGSVTGWQVSGAVECTAGAFICGFAGLPENVVVPFSQTDTVEPENLIHTSSTTINWSLEGPPPDIDEAQIFAVFYDLVGTETARESCPTCGPPPFEVPEPSAAALLGLTLIGFGWNRSRLRT
jgi:hypothetical protein